MGTAAGAGKAEVVPAGGAFRAAGGMFDILGGMFDTWIFAFGFNCS